METEIQQKTGFTPEWPFTLQEEKNVPVTISVIIGARGTFSFFSVNLFSIRFYSFRKLYSEAKRVLSHSDIFLKSIFKYQLMI